LKAAEPCPRCPVKEFAHCLSDHVKTWELSLSRVARAGSQLRLQELLHKSAHLDYEIRNSPNYPRPIAVFQKG
jgi:hypothetical protein